MCEKYYQLLAVGRWFPPGTPVSFTIKLISSSYHHLDMTLAVAEALNPNKRARAHTPTHLHPHLHTHTHTHKIIAINTRLCGRGEGYAGRGGGMSCAAPV